MPSVFNTTTLPLSEHTQILYNDLVFQCSGYITQVRTWYQAPGSDIEAPLAFQIWHPVNDSYFKLLSEVMIPPAINDTLVTIDNLRLPFFNGSFVGMFIQSPRDGFQIVNIMRRSVENIPSGFYVFGRKLCEFDVVNEGIAIARAYSPEMVITYGKYVATYVAKSYFLSNNNWCLILTFDAFI